MCLNLRKGVLQFANIDQKLNFFTVLENVVEEWLVIVVVVVAMVITVTVVVDHL